MPGGNPSAHNQSQLFTADASKRTAGRQSQHEHACSLTLFEMQTILEHQTSPDNTSPLLESLPLYKLHKGGGLSLPIPSPVPAASSSHTQGEADKLIALLHPIAKVQGPIMAADTPPHAPLPLPDHAPALSIMLRTVQAAMLCS